MASIGFICTLIPNFHGSCLSAAFTGGADSRRSQSEESQLQLQFRTASRTVVFNMRLDEFRLAIIEACNAVVYGR